jgi:hypothetical protein
MVETAPHEAALVSTVSVFLHVMADRDARSRGTGGALACSPRSTVQLDAFPLPDLP